MIELTEFEENLKSYLEISEEKADKQLSKLRSNAEKKIRDTERRLTNVVEDSEHFKEIITPDTKAMDKYSQKIYDTISEIIETIAKPKKITLRKLNEYIEKTRAALIEQDKVLIKYIKLLKDKKNGQ